MEKIDFECQKSSNDCFTIGFGFGFDASQFFLTVAKIPPILVEEIW